MMRPVMSSVLPLPRSRVALAREQRRQVLEQHLVLGASGGSKLIVVDLEQGEVALAFLRRADLAG
jgi:hypothetical protein